MPSSPSWRRDIATALWVALVSALLAPLLGLLLTALALDIAAVAGTGAATGHGAVGRFVGFLAAVPYTYVLALVFMGVPSALCGLVLGLILARLAHAGRAAPPVRAAAGAAVAATFAALIGWLPDESGANLPYPMWSVATACGAACGLVIRRTWLSRRIAMPA